MNRLGIGIIGGGTAALDLVRAIDAVPTVQLTAVHDRHEHLAAELATDRGATVHAGIEDLLTDPRVDVVYVGLPHDLLAPAARRALTANRHALVEKPMGLDVASIQDLDQLATRRRLGLGIMFQLRYHATTRVARRLLRAGAIGRVTTIRIWTVIDKADTYWQSGYRGRVLDDWRARRSRAGGGVVLMNSIHQIDLIRFVTGLAFSSASAMVRTVRAKVEVEDAAAAALALSNGGLASLVASAHSPGARDAERIEIDGTLGHLELPDPDGTAPVTMFLRRPWRGFSADVPLTMEAPHVDPYVEFLRAYAVAIRTGRPPPATAEDAIAALEAVLAIYESAATGRTAIIGRPR